MQSSPNLGLVARSLGLAASLAACGGAPHPRAPVNDLPAGNASPLGTSYMLVPLPGEDEALLGRVLPAPPEPGQSLEEIARPNPCADKLEPAKASPLASSFEDAQDVSVSAKARATLGAFGFQGDVESATHFYYKLATEKRLARTDTSDYEKCCAEKGCGYGYVSALVYGEGEYATGKESSASGAMDVVVASGGGAVKLKVLHRRHVRGYVAALVSVTDRKSAAKVGALGILEASGVQETALPETVKQIYEADKLAIAEAKSATDYVIKDGRGAHVTENDFARRFGHVTGTDELGDYDRHRHKAAMWTGIGLLATTPAFVYAAAWGWSGSAKAATGGSRCHQTDDCDARTVSAVVGTLGTMGVLGAGAALTVLGSDSEGDPGTDHDLPADEARLYVERYNRALLRKSVRDTQRVYQQSSDAERRGRVVVMPLVGAGQFGLTGSF